MKIFKYFLLSSTFLFPESILAASAVETEQSVPSYLSNIDVYEKAKAGDFSARKEYFERLYLGNFSNAFLELHPISNLLKTVNFFEMSDHEMFAFIFKSKKPDLYWTIVKERAESGNPTALLCQNVHPTNTNKPSFDEIFLKRALDSNNVIAIMMYIADNIDKESRKDECLELLQKSADLNSGPALSFLANIKTDISKEEKLRMIKKAADLDYSPALLAYGLYTNDADMIARAHAQGEKQESTHVVAEILKALRDD